MPNALSNTVGLLVNNSNPLPDAVTETRFGITDIAAAGTTQATATSIGTGTEIYSINNNTAANGAILPVGNVGQIVKIFPKLVTNAPKIYPPVGGTINFGTANASIAATAQKWSEFICLDETGLNWGWSVSA